MFRDSKSKGIIKWFWTDGSSLRGWDWKAHIDNPKYGYWIDVQPNDFKPVTPKECE